MRRRGTDASARASTVLGGRRAWLAWLVSALVHALVMGTIAYLAQAPHPKADGRASEPPVVDIEIDEIAPGAGLATHVRAPEKGGAAPVGPSRQPSRRASASSQRTDVPDTSARTAGGGRALDLSIGALPPSALRGLAGPAADDLGPGRPKRRLSVDELRVETERQEDAVANVEKGRADPILYDYLRGARRRFEVDAHRLAESIPVGAREMLRSLQTGHQKRVDDLADGGGAPSGSGLDPDLGAAALSGNRSQGQPTDLFSAYGQSTSQASEGAEERRAEVCLDMGPGKTPEPTLRRASGNAALDRLVLDSFSRAVAERPVPADVRPGIACYEVRISAFRMPPVPALACGFDDHGVNCVWPFKKIASVTGRLLSVDYTRGDPAAANHSLLRRPR